MQNQKKNTYFSVSRYIKNIENRYKTLIKTSFNIHQQAGDVSISFFYYFKRYIEKYKGEYNIIIKYKNKRFM